MQHIQKKNQPNSKSMGGKMGEKYKLVHNEDG